MNTRVKLGTFDHENDIYHVYLIAKITPLENEDSSSISFSKGGIGSDYYYYEEPRIQCYRLDHEGRPSDTFYLSGELTHGNKRKIELFKKQNVQYFSDFEEKDVLRVLQAGFNGLHDGLELPNDIHLGLASKLLFEPYEEFVKEIPDTSVFYSDKIRAILDKFEIPYVDPDVTHSKFQQCRKEDYQFINIMEKIREPYGHNELTKYELSVSKLLIYRGKDVFADIFDEKDENLTIRF